MLKIGLNTSALLRQVALGAVAYIMTPGHVGQDTQQRRPGYTGFTGGGVPSTTCSLQRATWLQHIL